MSDLDYFIRLGLALALGMLIGLERGWKERDAPEGTRVAGIRTYALLGLLGGVWALLAGSIDDVLLGFAFLAVAAVLTTAYWVSVRDSQDVGVTGLVAGLLTFAFGALVMAGHIALAAAGAVVVTILLGLKAPMHGWVRKIDRLELIAALKLLGISVVILPVLPNQGLGPWEALNPFRIWWMVILIVGISFAGYVAIRILGARLGLALTGIFGGLVSSTATTLAFARMARGRESSAPVSLLAGGILFACATLFIRTLVISAVVDHRVTLVLLPSFAAMAVAAYALGGWIWWRGNHVDDGTELSASMDSPMGLKPALIFGSLLVVILLLARALQNWLGDIGLYALAAASGLADTDALTLSLTELTRRDDAAVAVAALSLLTAVSVNTLVKAGLTRVIGGREVGRPVTGALLAVLAVGLPVYVLFSP